MDKNIAVCLYQKRMVEKTFPMKTTKVLLVPFSSLLFINFLLELTKIHTR